VATSSSAGFGDDSDTREEGFVEADPDPLETQEDRLVRTGVDDIETGHKEEVIAHDIRGASQLLDRIGRHDLAKQLRIDANDLGSIAEGDIERGKLELDQAETVHRQKEVEQLALQVVTGRQDLAVWQNAVKSITRVAKEQITPDQFAHAKGGDPAKGKQLQSDILTTGEWISRVLNHPIEDAKQAAHVVGRIFEFVAAVLTIYDHVPAPIKSALWQALQNLGPFTAYFFR